MNVTKIAVVITCHNLENFLPEAVESVLAQTKQPTEIIVVHDGCEAPISFKGVTNIILSENKGVAHARDIGFRATDSDWIVFLDGDDCLSENYIEAMIKAKDQFSFADVFYPNVLLWSRWHKDIKLKNAWHESDNEVSMESMLENCKIVVSSMMHRSVYEETGGFQNLPMLEDYALWLNALNSGSHFKKVPQAVLKYRQRQNGRNRQSDELKNQMYWQIREQYVKKKESGT